MKASSFLLIFQDGNSNSICILGRNLSNHSQMKFLKTFSLLLFIISCKSEPVIDYATAFRNCSIDTIRMTGPNDTMFFYQPEIEGLIGAQLPDFVATSLDGKTIDKNYFAGKVSVINFWFEGCHPCEDEMPVFNKLVDRYKDQDVNFLAIGLNSPKDVKDFLQRSPFNFDHIAYGEHIIKDTFKMAWGYPITFVADNDMKIVSIFKGLGDTTKVTDAQRKFTEVIDDALAAD